MTKTTDTFTGLCVGGPMAGQVIAQRTKTFRVEERLPLKMALARSIADEEFSFITRTYTWHHMGGPLALWIIEGWDITKALNAMAEAYVEKQNNLGGQRNGRR